ncbi:hypothetical protein KY285_010800 [Solanum tuberosum]|nr:hypothetical protein KY289_011373 [Solanum tuberosum]KAH0735093.1 hypothetical protein KY285_010800 [Solanum tuberosum]
MHEGDESGEMKANNVMPFQEFEDLNKALVLHTDLQNTEQVTNDNGDLLNEDIHGEVVSEEQHEYNETCSQKTEVLDKTLVVHKDHQILHANNLGGHGVVVLDMVGFEEDPLLSFEDAENILLTWQTIALC